MYERSYGTPLVTKIQDTQHHVQNTQCHVQNTQRHVERFLNVTLRMVSASFLVLKLLILSLFLYCQFLTSHTLELQCALRVCASCFYAITRPHKTMLHDWGEHTLDSCQCNLADHACRVFFRQHRNSCLHVMGELVSASQIWWTSTFIL